MIENYLNQTTTWRRQTGTDGWGEPTFEDTPIKVRWEARRQLVRNEQGEEVTSEAQVFTEAAVATGDSLVDPSGREWPVITVGKATDLGGTVQFREVSV